MHRLSTGGFLVPGDTDHRLSTRGWSIGAVLLGSDSLTLTVPAYGALAASVPTYGAIALSVPTYGALTLRRQGD